MTIISPTVGKNPLEEMDRDWNTESFQLFHCKKYRLAKVISSDGEILKIYMGKGS